MGRSLSTRMLAFRPTTAGLRILSYPFVATQSSPSITQSALLHHYLALVLIEPLAKYPFLADLTYSRC